MSKYGEPFKYYALGNNSVLQDSDGYNVIDICPEPGRNDWIVRNDQLQRIAVCVNACADLNDPAAFMGEVRELLQDCKDFVAENEVATIPAHAHGLSAADGCPCCGELADDGHAVDCATIRLRTRISVMLARLEPAGRESNA